MSILGRVLQRPPAASAPTAGVYGSGGTVVDWPWSGSPPESWLRGTKATTVETAVGAPALLGVILRLSGAASLCPFIVTRAGEGDARERARDSQAWRLLHDGDPRGDLVPSSLWGDLVASLAGTGSFFVRKVKVRGDVVDLVVRDPRRVRARWTPVGELVFDDSTGGGRETVTRADMIFGRLASAPGCVEGISPIGALRRSIEATLDNLDMEDRVVANDARPGLVVKWPGPLSQEQADEWGDKWMSRHGGENRGKPTILPAGADIDVIPVNLADLQFVERTKMSRETMAGAYGVPVPMLGDPRAATYEDRIQFTTFALGPLQRAISGAFLRDADIFPPGEGLSGDFLVDAILRTATRERYEAYRLARQGGWVTANELRAKEDLPPVEGGDEIQVTPVGGAPNNAGPADTPGGEDPTPDQGGPE